MQMRKFSDMAVLAVLVFSYRQFVRVVREGRCALLLCVVRQFNDMMVITWSAVRVPTVSGRCGKPWVYSIIVVIVM